LTVKLQNVDPPKQVQASFNEVNQARQEKEQTINEARAAYNKAIPAARGAARKEIQSAEGYAAKRVNEAYGDVALFNALQSEYENAKGVTRARLYLEAMAEFLPKLQKITIVDSGTGGLLKVLDLEGARDKKRGGQ
jgi:membrane protease subunit HflK